MSERERPNPHQTWDEFAREKFMHESLYGHSFVWDIPNADGTGVSESYVIHPFRVMCHRNPAGEETYEITSESGAGRVVIHPKHITDSRKPKGIQL